MSRMKTQLLAVTLVLVACAAPNRPYDVDQIGTLDNLEDLMDVQATFADPAFDRLDGLGDGELADADWQMFHTMGTRLVATSSRIRALGLSQGEDFDAWNNDLGMRAGQLAQAADVRDRANVVANAKAIRAACKACHDKYR